MKPHMKKSVLLRRDVSKLGGYKTNWMIEREHKMLVE